MTIGKLPSEPAIAVGLLDGAESVGVRLQGGFTEASGRSFPPGEYRVRPSKGGVRCTGPVRIEAPELILCPADPDSGRFSIEATIGIDFHWQQTEVQAFVGGLRLVPGRDDRVTAINDVPLEAYITSVICSEMRSSSPPELAKAHAIISRSWLLAQLGSKGGRKGGRRPAPAGEIIRWTDREAHGTYDVCADDHCQRYQGVGRIGSAQVAGAVRHTRGRVLTYGGKVCDARFSKCCGGVTEDFRTAWSDDAVPYLVPLADGPDESLPNPPLTEEAAVRAFIQVPPDAYCNCTDERILGQVLNDYDLRTGDFFRWQVRLGAKEAGDRVRAKAGLDLGRILSIEPVERGLSGRLKRLRLTGERGAVIIGKELEIRRVLSPSHLYSSAFVVDPSGPDAFVLRGAGWGHGVGLCQIGAAAMAFQDIDHEAILDHYYPGAGLESAYD